MKKQFISKIFALIGFLLLAFVALNMNACSKDKNAGAGNPYGQYGQFGNVGGGFLANGIGRGVDMEIRLTFSGTNGGAAGASGNLFVKSNACPGLYAGQTYILTTQQAGVYYNGDFDEHLGTRGITLITNTGIPIFIEGFLNMAQDPQGYRYMSAFANIPGCPTNFY